LEILKRSCDGRTGYAELLDKPRLRWNSVAGLIVARLNPTPHNLKNVAMLGSDLSD
jgi:hypothetical protein